MANISAFSINNCFANVADNNVHENIVSAENLTEEEVAAKIDETKIGRASCRERV